MTEPQQPDGLVGRPLWRRIVFKWVALAVLVLVLWLSAPHRMAAPQDMAVVFVGFTNMPTGSAAVFLITNGTAREHHFEITRVEYKGYAQGGSGSPKPGQGLLGSLGPGQGIHWPVPVENTNVVWRLRLHCQEKATGLPGAIDKGKEVANRMKTGNTTHIFHGRQYEVTSDVAQ
jgi:hypothetical protein